MDQNYYCNLYNHCGHCPKWTGVDCLFDLDDTELEELEIMKELEADRKREGL